MDKRTTKTKKGILIAVIIACLLALIAGTYARYTSTGTATVNAEIAKWHVELNGSDISTESKTVQVPLAYAQNDFVKDGKIAPGRSATLTVEVDPTGSEVAIDYIFDIDTDALADALEANSTSAISITGATYKVGDGEAQSATISNGVITVSEGLSDVEADKKVTVTVTVAWDNANDANNESDTNEGVASYAKNTETGKVLTIPVTVTASQKI